MSQDAPDPRGTWLTVQSLKPVWTPLEGDFRWPRVHIGKAISSFHSFTGIGNSGMNSNGNGMNGSSAPSYNGSTGGSGSPNYNGSPGASDSTDGQ
jgi:hypothetical protein